MSSVTRLDDVVKTNALIFVSCLANLSRTQEKINNFVFSTTFVE